MEFKLAYLNAMRDQAPAMFNELRRTGALDAFVQEKALEAHRMFRQLTANAPKGPAGLVKQPYMREAEELVFAALIEFPPDDDPDDEPEIESLGEDGPLTAPPAY